MFRKADFFIELSVVNALDVICDRALDPSHASLASQWKKCKLLNSLSYLWEGNSQGLGLSLAISTQKIFQLPINEEGVV